MVINNDFFKHLCNAESQRNWVEIENEYYKFLCYPFDRIIFSDYAYKDIHLLNTDFNYVKTKLNNYLSNLLSKSIFNKSGKIQEIIYSTFSITEFKEEAMKIIISQEAHKIKEYGKFENPDLLSPKTISLINMHPEVDEGYLTIKAIDANFWNMFFDFLPDDIMFLNFNYTNIEELYINRKTPFNKKVYSSGYSYSW